MGGLFGGGGQKYVAPPIVTPTPPVIEDASAKAESDTDALRRRAGRASTVLAGSSTSGDSPTTATKALTGA